MTLVYYDTETDHLFNMTAAHNTVMDDNDPMPIAGMMLMDTMSTSINPSGGATLVPGFMKDVEAGRALFGKVAFADLFAPSIHFA